MLKVLIVDDEALVRIGIKTIIPWTELGFELVGEADNGKKALEMVRTFSPDIILTDIKMPVMTGIELIKQLRKESNPARCIILSSYDDLEYVKEGMKLGAEDYILKLELEPEQLVQILTALRESIQLMRNSTTNVVPSQEGKAAHGNLHKEKLFKDMLLGVVQSREEIQYKLEVLNICLPHEHLGCFIVEVDDLKIYQKYGENPHLLDYSILNILEEILASYVFGSVVSIHSGQFIAVFSLRVLQDRDYRSCLDDLTDNIRTILYKYLNTSVCIGISQIHQNYEHIILAYKEAKEAASFKFIRPRGSNIYYSECKIDLPVNSEDLSMELKKVEKALHDGEIHAIIEALNEFVFRIEQSNCHTKEQLTGFCYTVYYLIQSFTIKYQLTNKNIINREIYNNIHNLTLKVDFSEWIQQLVRRITEELIENNEGMRIMLTKQYINKHYKEELTLEKVSDYLQLSSAYLSNLYKKETGQNFIEYVTEVRIGQAKILLKTTTMKIAEIAREVGYTDEYYFSKVFKKITGQSPQKYR